MTKRGSTVSEQIVREVIGDLPVFKGRSALALIGIAIGTAAVIAMLHVGHNARAAALQQFETLGTDLVMMQPQSLDGAIPQVSLDDVLALPRERIGIVAVAAVVQAGGSFRAGQTDVHTMLMATTEGIRPIGKTELRQGRFISDLDGFSPFAVVGAGIAREMETATARPMTIGSRIHYGNQVLTVIGVLKDAPTNLILNLDFNRSVIIPFKAARRVIPQPVITHVAGRLAPGASDERTAEAVAKYFLTRMSSGQMQVTTARQVIANIEDQMRIYAVLILGIGAVSLIVGGVGIMNVMLISVMERRQEIGLRLALGARRKDIRLMFLSEALILSAIGSAIGTAIGYLVGRLFAGGFGWQFDPAPLALPLGVAMALIVGLFFGVYPAVRASRLDPVAALRSEG